MVMLLCYVSFSLGEEVVPAGQERMRAVILIRLLILDQLNDHTSVCIPVKSVHIASALTWPLARGEAPIASFSLGEKVVRHRRIG